MRAIIQDRILFDRNLLGKVVAFFGPALQLFSGAFAIAKNCFPGMGRALVILAVCVEKSLDEFIGSEFVVELEHRGNSFRA